MIHLGAKSHKWDGNTQLTTGCPDIVTADKEFLYQIFNSLHFRLDSTFYVVFSLYQDYPNPFNPKTKINFEISKSTNVKLTVYNILGQEVLVLMNEFKTPVKYSADFDGSNFASGV